MMRWGSWRHLRWRGRRVLLQGGAVQRRSSLTDRLVVPPETHSQLLVQSQCDIQTLAHTHLHWNASDSCGAEVVRLHAHLQHLASDDATWLTHLPLSRQERTQLKTTTSILTKYINFWGLWRQTHHSLGTRSDSTGLICGSDVDEDCVTIIDRDQSKNNKVHSI